MTDPSRPRLAAKPTPLERSSAGKASAAATYTIVEQPVPAKRSTSKRVVPRVPWTPTTAIVSHAAHEQARKATHTRVAEPRRFGSHGIAAYVGISSKVASVVTPYTSEEATSSGHSTMPSATKQAPRDDAGRVREGEQLRSMRGPEFVPCRQEERRIQYAQFEPNHAKLTSPPARSEGSRPHDADGAQAMKAASLAVGVTPDGLPTLVGVASSSAYGASPRCSASPPPPLVAPPWGVPDPTSIISIDGVPVPLPVPLPLPLPLLLLPVPLPLPLPLPLP